MTRRNLVRTIAGRLALGLWLGGPAARPTPAGDDPAPGPTPAKSATADVPRPVSASKTRQVQELEQRIATLVEAGKFTEAADLARRIVELRRRVQGPNHWQVSDAERYAETLTQVAGLDDDLRVEYSSLGFLQTKADALYQQGRYADAQPWVNQVLTIHRHVLGEDHPDTAASYNSVAGNLRAQGRYTEAQPLLEKALAIRREVLGEAHPDTALSYNNVASNLAAQGRYADAQPLYEKALAIRRKVLGEAHPDTASSYNGVAFDLNAQGRYADAQPLYERALAIWRKVLGEEHPDTATGYNNVASNLNAQGRYADAQPLYEKALAISRRLVGEDHPDTADGYNGVGFNWNAQGRYAEAQPPLEKALAIRRKVLGEDHPDTAFSYKNVASNLAAQGRYTDAQLPYEKALAIRRKVLGEGHPDTATSYNGVASNLNAQGRYADAQPLYEKALAIRRRVLGEEHPDTATGYNNVAINLAAQGRYADAQPLYEKALAIKRKVFGEDHADTALGYNNVATNLDDQGRYADAQPLYQKALTIKRKVLGEDHPGTALSYNNAAYNLEAQGRYADAQPLYEKALAIRRKALGEDHPDTALNYNNVAYNLEAQGRYTEAQPLYEQALAIFRKMLGEEHPDTANSDNNLATNCYHLGQFDRAERLWTRSAEVFSRLRGRMAVAGLDRATAAEGFSPMLPLAALLARRGAADAAWQRFESDLARGLLDDLSARQARRLTEPDRRREQELIARLNRLDTRAEQLAAREAQGQTDPKARDRLEQERVEANAEWSAFQLHLEQGYGVAAGQILDLPRIQEALPADAALVGWLDLDQLDQHWGVVVRRAGRPHWVALPGRGPDGRWTEPDRTLAAHLAAALADRGRTAEDPSPAIAALAAQRLTPLAPALGADAGLPAARRLIVLPAPALRGVPIALLAAKMTVSYAPSGSVFAWLRERPRPAADRPPDLLAVADPAFPAPEVGPPVEPPNSGVLLTAVGPGSNAAGSGLKPGDVLLEYAGRPLSGPAALIPAIARSAGEEHPIPVTAWRVGHRLALSMSPGKLGAVFDQRPARQVIVAERDFDGLMRGARGGSWAPLPGTRREAAAIAELVRQRDGRVELLLGPEATETALHRLAAGSESARYRFVHLATHGQPNLDRAFESTLALAQPPATEAPDASGWADDGRLTAAEILRTWRLDADLVTLSACESAVGRYAGGEGYLGFTQALLLAGARSVVLSLWKVDDTATALLMRRFYENLLGGRADVSSPMGKAEALREAQQWLRGLRQAEVDALAASLPGPSRGGTVKDARPVRRPVGSGPTLSRGEPRPFAHPYYWAAFVLVGDPE